LVFESRSEADGKEQLMATDKIVIVHLRRPGTDDKRNDPFWEFGSFGITGCHKHNLMNPERIHELDGVRLAFAQGGEDGFKLVFLTPPISTVKHKKVAETRWQPASMPLRYNQAPIVVANNGTMMDGMKKALQGVNRSTLEAKFSSRFRSRRNPINEDFPELAQQIVREFARRYKRAKENHAVAQTYDEALPRNIEAPDRQRHETYERKLDEAGGVVAKKKWGSCSSRKHC
jgi:hypothetical protein